MENRIDFIEAIEAQPAWMKRCAELACDALAEAALEPWCPDQTVAVVGMGSSSNAGAVFVEALRALGQRAVNIDASAVANYPVGFCPADHVIVISESGRSPEPIAAAQRMGVAPLVITNDLKSPLARLGQVIVPLGGFTDSGVYTIGYTTTLVALAVIAQACQVPVVDPAALAGVAGEVLDDFSPDQADAAAAVLNQARYLDIVGQGVAAGSAAAASLLFREAAGLAASAHQSIQYLHGPMESCTAEGAVLLFGDGRERAMAVQLREAGVPVVQFATSAGPGENVYRVPTPVDGYGAGVAQIVFAQRLAASLAALRHKPVGQFRFSQPDTKLPL